MFIRHWRDWLEIAAWTSKRLLGWFAGFKESAKVGSAVPDFQIWRESVGWLVLVLVVSWITRMIWSWWNSRAMREVYHGSRESDPIGFVVAFWAQTWFAIYLVSPSFGSSLWGYGLSFCAMCAMALSTTSSRRTPRVLSELQPDAKSSGAERAVKAVWNLLQALMMIGAIAWLYLIVAPRFLAEHLGGTWGEWVIGFLVTLALLVIYGAIRRRLKR